MRVTLTKIHTILAAFLLPMGLMYAVTGGLYTWGVKGEHKATEVTLDLGEPLPVELSALVALAEAELKARGLDVPTGGAGLRKGGTSQYFEWTGSSRDVQIHPTADPTRATLKILEASPHRYFVQLHKAKGGVAFRFLAAVWALGLVGLFVSGGAIAVMARPYRKLAAASALLGLLAFGVLAWLS